MYQTLWLKNNETSDTSCETTWHQDCKTMTQGNSSQPGGPKGPADLFVTGAKPKPCAHVFVLWVAWPNTHARFRLQGCEAKTLRARFWLQGCEAKTLRVRFLLLGCGAKNARTCRHMGCEAKNARTFSASRGAKPKPCAVFRLIGCE